MSENPWGGGRIHCQHCSYEIEYQGQPAWSLRAVQSMVDHLRDEHGLDALGRPMTDVELNVVRDISDQVNDVNGGFSRDLRTLPDMRTAHEIIVDDLRQQVEQLRSENERLQAALTDTDAITHAIHSRAEEMLTLTECRRIAVGVVAVLSHGLTREDH